MWAVYKGFYNFDRIILTVCSPFSAIGNAMLCAVQLCFSVEIHWIICGLEGMLHEQVVEVQGFAGA
jgi:hypothetical protein